MDDHIDQVVSEDLISVDVIIQCKADVGNRPVVFPAFKSRFEKARQTQVLDL